MFLDDVFLQILKVNTFPKNYKIPILKEASHLDERNCPVENVDLNPANQSSNKSLTQATSYQKVRYVLYYVLVYVIVRKIFTSCLINITVTDKTT